MFVTIFNVFYSSWATVRAIDTLDRHKIMDYEKLEIFALANIYDFSESISLCLSNVYRFGLFRARHSTLPSSDVTRWAKFSVDSE